MLNNVLDILPRAEMRRSTRIVRAVPMRVTGVDLLGQPFWERTATLDLNSHGCRYPSRQKVKTNSWLTLELTDREANRLLHSVQARVVWVRPPQAQQEYFHIGVELEVSGNVWGIALPPGDWSPFRKPSPLQISTVVAGSPATAQAPPASVSEEELGELFHLGADASPAQPRAWLVSEVQQQNQKIVPEAAAAAVAAEASRLLDELRAQLEDEAKRIIEGMAAPHTDQWLRRPAQKPYEAQHAGAKSLHEQWTRKIDQTLREVSDHPAASTTESVQRILEASQRDLATRFVSQLQQQLAPLLDQPQEVLTKLAPLKSPRRILRRGPAILAQAAGSAWTEGSQAMFCIKCGAENSGEAGSCWKCGKSILTVKSEQVPSAAAISPPPAPVTHSRAQPQPKNEPLPQGSTASSPGEENLMQSSGPTHSPGTSGSIAGPQGTNLQAFVRTYRRMMSDQLLAVAKDLSCLSETAWTEGTQAMFCIKCGAENSGEADSCWKCGKSIFTVKSEQVPSAAAISLPPAPVTHSRAQPQPRNEPLPQGSTASTPGHEDLMQSSGPTHSPGTSGRIAGLQGTNIQAFVRTYRRMTSAQLLALAKDLPSLSETARNSLVAELRRRGLEAGQPLTSKPKRHYKRIGGWLARFILASIVFSPILTIIRLAV